MPLIGFGTQKKYYNLKNFKIKSWGQSPVSVPTATRPKDVETPAALPPLEPAVVRVVSYGLCTTPKRLPRDSRGLRDGRDVTVASCHVVQGAECDMQCGMAGFSP